MAAEALLHFQKEPGVEGHSTLGPGAKMGHFSYVGDSKVGENTNVSAGVITCNYDGEHKHETEIGENRELYVIKRKGYLKLVPKHRVDLTECFDSVDLGVEAIDSWRQFEKRFHEVRK